MTQKEIANLLNMSYSTVSLALSDSPKVKESTRIRIKEMAKSLGYRPNLAATSLKGRNSRVIGVIFPEFANSYYGELTDNIHRLMKEKSYSGLFHTARGSDIDFVVDEMISRRVDGVISFCYNLQSLMPIHQAQIPLIIYNNSSLPFSSVNVNRYKGGHMVGDYFIRKGYSNMGYIGAGKYGEDPRMTGFKSALAAGSINLSDHNIAYGSGMKSGYEGMKELLQNQEKPDAVFCFNDTTAMGAYRAVHEAGLTIPDDIAIIGFDNIKETQYMVPALSTVRQPIPEIATKLMTLLLSQIEKPDHGLETVSIEPELVIRESC